MSCAHIRGYLDGWSHFQARLYGKKEESEPDEFEGICPQDQEALFQQMTMRPKPNA